MTHLEEATHVIPWPYPEEFPPRITEPRPRENHDDRVARLVAAQLAADTRTRSQRITVTAQNQVVILIGEVDSPRAKQVAGDLAWRTPQVFDVCNALVERGARRRTR